MSAHKPRICAAHRREMSILYFGWWFCPVFNERCREKEKK